MKKITHLIALLSMSTHSTQAMFLASQEYKKKVNKLDELIKTHNYDAIEKILQESAPRIDRKDAFNKIGTALDECEKYQKKQQNRSNNLRLISALSAVICTAISIGIIFFDRRNLFHQFSLSSNLCHYGAGAFGMFGLKFTMDAFFNTAAQRAYEQAATVYAVFARYRGNWEMKYHTEPNLPIPKDI